MKNLFIFLSFTIVYAVYGAGITTTPSLTYGAYPPNYLQDYNYLYSANSLYYWSYLYPGLNNPNQIYTQSDIENMPWLKEYMRKIYGANAVNQPVFNPIVYITPSKQPNNASNMKGQNDFRSNITQNNEPKTEVKKGKSYLGGGRMRGLMDENFRTPISDAILYNK